MKLVICYADQESYSGYSLTKTLCIWFKMQHTQDFLDFTDKLQYISTYLSYQMQ